MWIQFAHALAYYSAHAISIQITRNTGRRDVLDLVLTEPEGAITSVLHVHVFILTCVLPCCIVQWTCDALVCMHAKLKGIRSLVCVSVTPISWRTRAGKRSTGIIIISNLIVLDFWVKALFYSYGMIRSPQTLLWHIPDFPGDQPAHSESPCVFELDLCNNYSFLQQNYVVNKYPVKLAPSLARHQSYLITTQNTWDMPRCFIWDMPKYLRHAQIFETCPEDHLL